MNRRPQTFDHKGNILGTAQVPAVQKDLPPLGDAVLRPDGRCFFRRHGPKIRFLAVGTDLHLLGLQSWIVPEHILHIGGTHATDLISQSVELFLLGTEIPIHRTALGNSAQVGDPLRPDVLEKQVELRSVPLFDIGHHAHQSDRRRGHQDEVIALIPAMPVQGPPDIGADLQRRDAFFEESHLLHLGRLHMQNGIALAAIIIGGAIRLDGNDADKVSVFDKDPQKIRIDPPVLQRRNGCQRQK